MLLGRFYTAETFNSIHAARETLEWLLATEIINFEKFGANEPITRKLDRDELTKPAKLLSGYPVHTKGGIFLRAAEHETVLQLDYRVGHLNKWALFADESLVADGTSTNDIIDFLTEFCMRHDVVYAGVDLESVWTDRHEFVEGTSTRKRGLSMEEQLPGIYWFTYLDGALFNRLENGSATPDQTWSDARGQLNGVAFQLSESPSNVTANKTQATDLQRELGEEYFFDPENGTRPERSPLEEVHDRVEAAAEFAHVIPYLPQQYAARFDREIRSVDGDVLDDPSELAENLIVYLHAEVEELFDADISAIESLDEYLRREPQKYHYTRDHLDDEFVPALGAYLGEVYVDEYGVEWTDEDHLMARALTWDEYEPRVVSPFHLAHHVVYNDMRLVDFHDYISQYLE